MKDPELGRLIACYWKRPDGRYWRGGWYPVPPERRDEFQVVRSKSVPATKKYRFMYPIFLMVGFFHDLRRKQLGT